MTSRDGSSDDLGACGKTQKSILPFFKKETIQKSAFYEPLSDSCAFASGFMAQILPRSHCHAS